MPKKKQTKKAAPDKIKKTSKNTIDLLVCGTIDYGLIEAVYETYEPNKNYIMTICSTGGNFMVCVGVIDFLTNARNSNKLITVGMGDCMSAGALLLLSGSPGYRFAYPNTIISMHIPCLSDIIPDSATQYSLSQHLSLATKRYFAILDQFTKHDARWWKNTLRGKSMLHFDVYEALELGLIDDVL